MEPEDRDKFKSLLEERRKELNQLRDAATDAQAPVALDQQSVGRVSRVDAMQQQAMAKAQEANRTRELARIELALRRIADDEFGECVDCGEPISTGRLKIDPSVSLCIKCASNN